MFVARASRNVDTMQIYLKKLLFLIAFSTTSACLSAPQRTTAAEPSPRGDRWVYGGASSGDTHSSWVTSSAVREAHLTGDDTQLLVQAKINGLVSGVFLLDTGATYCVITPATARRLGVPYSAGDETITLATPTGEIEAPITVLRTLEVASAQAGHVRTVIYPAVEPPLAGIIGLSFLKQFNFSVDIRHHVLRLRPF